MEVFDFKIAQIYCETKERLILEKVFKLFQNNIEQVLSNVENYKKVTITTFPLKDQNMISIKSNNPANIYEQILVFFLKRNVLSGYYNLIPKLVEYIKNNFHPINYEEFIYFYQETALKCYEEKEKYMPTIVFTYLYYHYQENLWKVLQRNITTWSKIKFDGCSFFDNRFNTHFVLDSDEKIVDLISKNIDCGWLDKAGNKYGNLHEWKEKYIIYPIEIMLQNKLGCCIDKSRIISFLLNKIGCSNMIIFEKRTTEGKEWYHAFVIYEKNGQWYRINYRDQIVPINSVDEVIEEEKRRNTVAMVVLPDNIDYKSIKEVVEMCFGKSRTYLKHGDKK